MLSVNCESKSNIFIRISECVLLFMNEAVFIVFCDSFYASSDAMHHVNRLQAEMPLCKLN